MLKTLLNKISYKYARRPKIDAFSDFNGALVPKLPESHGEKIQGDILFLTPDPWNPNRWARKQMFAYLMQTYFDRVFYYVDYRQSGTTKPFLEKVAENMFIYYQGVGWNIWHSSAESTALKNLLQIIKRLQLCPKAIMAYQFPNAVLAEKVAKEIGQDCKMFYDLTDDWTNFPGFSEAKIKKRLTEEETSIKNADKVFSVSRRLFEWGRKNNPNTIYLPNATDFELMKTTQEDGSIADELKGLRRPIIGYTGRITPWRLDWKLLYKIADMKEEPTLVMIGEVHPNCIALRDKLLKKKNVRFLGPREYYKLPTFYRGFDVCILPHSMDTQTASMDPIKLYDYMGSGKPIVATAVEEAKKFSNVLQLANNHVHFLILLQKTWRSKNHNPGPQMEIARQNSWIIRAEELAKHIAKTIIDSDTKNNF